MAKIKNAAVQSIKRAIK